MRSLKNRSIVTLLLILSITAFLRVYRLGKVPSGFFADEAAIGYNAYTILNQGKDEYGQPFPIFFRSFGDFKHPIQIYSTVPQIAILGLNETSVRLTSVLYGVATIIFLYLLACHLSFRRSFCCRRAFYSPLYHRGSSFCLNNCLRDHLFFEVC